MPFKDLLKHEKSTGEELGIGLLTVLSIAGALLLLYKNKTIRKTILPVKDVDIEIRYDVEKDADTTFLAQNIVKIVRIVLAPLAGKIKKEDAKLIFVFTGESWEMRTVHASDVLKNLIRKQLASREW